MRGWQELLKVYKQCESKGCITMMSGVPPVHMISEAAALAKQRSKAAPPAKQGVSWLEMHTFNTSGAQFGANILTDIL